MSPRNWKDYIQDILNAIQEIFVFTSDTNFESFRNDVKTIRAVELNFIIIGEAVNAIPEVGLGYSKERSSSSHSSPRKIFAMTYINLHPTVQL